MCARFLLGRFGGRHRLRSAQPTMGHTSRVSGADGLGPQPVEVPMSLPAEIAELELLEGQLPRHAGASFGVVKDRRAHTYTATLMCQSSAFYLLSEADREARLAAYGGVLAALARDHGPTRRIAWYERTLPPGSDQLAEYLHQAKRSDAGMREPPVELVSYLELLAGQGDGAEDHEVLVSVQVDAARPVAGRTIRDLGGGDQGALLVLADELDLLAHRLSQAGVVVAGVLNRRGLASAIRNGFDPFGRHVRDMGQQNGRVSGVAAAHRGAARARRPLVARRVRRVAAHDLVDRRVAADRRPRDVPRGTVDAHGRDEDGGAGDGAARPGAGDAQGRARCHRGGRRAGAADADRQAHLSP